MGAKGVFLALLLVTVTLGCLINDGKITIDISGLKKIKEKVSIPSTPEEICKQNVAKELSLKAEKSPIRILSTHVVEVKKFEDVAEANKFLDTYILWSNPIPYKGNETKTIEPFYIAIGVMELERPILGMDREFKRFFCDPNGTIVATHPPIIKHPELKILPRYRDMLFVYEDSLGETINVTIRLSWDGKTTFWEKTLTSSFFETSYPHPEGVYWAGEGVGKLVFIESEIWHKRFGKISRLDYK